MGVTDDDQIRAIDLVLRDVHATIGTGYDDLVRENAAHLRTLVDSKNEYLERVAEDTQQALHDLFIDTDWPRCPLHQRHPLWLHDGAWWCEQDRRRIAALGELGSLSRFLQKL